MLSCRSNQQHLITLLLYIGMMMMMMMTKTTIAFTMTPKNNIIRKSTFLFQTKTVEVCGFKDCKRAGGGVRLENLVNSIVEEKGLVDVIKVEGCDCQVCINNHY